MTATRFSRLDESMDKTGMTALALNPGPTFTYLTGLTFHSSERPVVLLYLPGQKPVLVLPVLERLKAESVQIPLDYFTYPDNPATWSEAFVKACMHLGLHHQVIGVEPKRFRVLELHYLESAAPGIKVTSAETLLSGLRIQKDADEIAAMKQAVTIAEKAFLNFIPILKAGMTEREAASELTIQLLRAGSDPAMPFSPIIASGPNSANPHAFPGDRKLALGDLVVVDWGAGYRGYVADLTRTLAIGEVENEFVNVGKIVKEANTAGRMAARSGRKAGEVDRAARAVIEQAGYGEYFTHRTGHGLGMEGHEEPYMYAENDLILLSGMAFTVEPGVYLKGRGGVRIEDDLIITKDGAESLSNLSRDLYFIG